MRSPLRYALVIGIALVLGACSGQNSGAGVPNSPSAQHVKPLGSRSPIQNLIVVIQRDRSFDNIFAGYPGADAPTKGLTSKGTYVALKPASLQTPACALRTNDLSYFKVAWDNGKMDGWNLLSRKHSLCPYTRLSNADRRPYWELAKQYALADHAFASTHYGSFVNMLYLIAGSTQLNQRTYVAGPPLMTSPWGGCDSPPGARTTILKNGKIHLYGGPFPCFSFPTTAQQLDNASITWRYYYDSQTWNPYEAIAYVFEGSDWRTDMSYPPTNVLTDIVKGNLATVSFVQSEPSNSDVPGSCCGPKWVAAIADALKNSQYWQHSAMVVVWSDEGDGNFYDNVAPPQLDPMGLGFRVPILAISPYAKRGYVSHTTYEFGSILKFIEESYNLPFLSQFSTDRRANSIADMFRF
ncbi:MAG: hypothetical protein JO351_02930 [Candidatus Eremiobacteraeota bacterium]|nr:hypothetical protein [Candidatus Eremiobacteraeota bacterium]